MRRRSLLTSVGLAGFASSGLLVGAATAQPAGIPDGTPRIWPTGSDATDGSCTAANGRVKPATGPNSAAWYVFGGCGTWKVFPVVGGATYYIRATGDHALLDDISYAVQELEGGSWVTKMRQIYGHDPGGEHIDTYVPSPDAEQIRILRLDGGSGIGFYVRVYGPEQGGLEGIVEKRELIDTIRVDAGQILPEARAEQLDERAEALLADIDQAQSNDEATFQHQEALDRMLTAERVTLSGARIGRDPARETSEAVTELSVMIAFLGFAKGLIRGGGLAGRVIVAKIEDLAATAKRIIKRVAGRPVLSPSASRKLDDIIDEVNRRVDGWIDEYADDVETAGEEIVSGPSTINDVFDLVGGEVVEALASIKEFAVEKLTVIFYESYMTDAAAHNRLGIRTHPPGIDSSIDNRTGELEQAIDDGSLEAAGADERQEAQQDRVTTFEQQREAFVEGMKVFDEVGERAALGVLALGALAILSYGISLLLAATSVGAGLAGGLATFAKLIATIAGGLGSISEGLTTAPLLLGFGFLQDRQVDHDATVDFIINYEAH